MRWWFFAHVTLLACQDGAVGSDAGQSADTGTPARERDAGEPAVVPFRPDLVPNRFERVRDDLPSLVWETGVAYEPRVGSLFQHGGHLLESYAQTAYTWRYDARGDALIEALPSTRPMRRCIVELAWLDGPDWLATVQGAASHGTLPSGWIQGWRVTRSDARGPWLYDALTDRWEHARPSGAEWPRRTHAGIAYDATSDALYVVGPDGLYAYAARANRVVRLPMPAALFGRQGYAMAFDPDARRLVVFGGSTRHWTYGHIDGDETDNCNVVDAETCASYYRAYVRDDTWVLDVDEAARAGWTEGEVPAGWHSIEGAHPPRGMPMWNHQRLQLVWHGPSGRMLLLQNPIDDTPAMEPASWPAVEAWTFDARAEAWERADVEEPPHFAGLLAYAPDLDVLFSWGGGERGADAAMDRSATGSRTLYAMRPELGAALSPPSVPRISVGPIDATRVEVRFAAQPGRRYEIARAPATPIAGAYETIAEVDGETEVRFTDDDPGAHAYRVRELGTERWSLPAFDTPDRPGELVAIAGTAEVELRWREVEHAIGYRVYRSGPGENRRLVAEVDTASHHDTIDLSDGLVRFYVVTAIDVAGRESGSSPMAFTVPDAPIALDVDALPDGRFEVHWQQRDASERLELRYLDYHCNARNSIELFLDAFTLVEGGPFEAGTAIVSAPALDPATRDLAPTSEPGECARTLREGPYFYGRIVNALDQAGLYSDIVSPTDPRFRAALPD